MVTSFKVDVRKESEAQAEKQVKMYQHNSTSLPQPNETFTSSLSADFLIDTSHLWSTTFFSTMVSNNERYTYLNTSNHDVDGDGYLLDMVASSLWSSLFKLRFLFYLVWPTETMFPSLEKVPRYVTEMFPVFFLMAILENGVRLLQGKSSIRVNETVGSLSQGIFQECLRIKVRSIEVLMYCLIWEHFRLVTLPWNSLLTWWLCYLGVDFGFYWAHRLAHEVNFIWAIHQAHHSSTEFSIVSALRQAVLQPFTAWITYMPIALFVPPQIFLAHLQLTELYMAWLHTEIVDQVGPLELILNTPSHHRVHHSRNPEYIDKNYGGMLIIWDRLYGTFKGEDKSNPPVYGLVHPIKSFDPIQVQFHPWPVIWRRVKRAKNFRDKLGIIFKGPGWRPGLDNRLGNPEELPEIVRPINVYDPQISWWQNAYIVVHFALLLLFYHELTFYQDQFSPLLLNLGILSLLVTITSLGIMLDNKRPYRTLYELARCLLFFPAKDYILHIVASKNHFKSLVIFVIFITFTLSVLLNLVMLTVEFVKINYKCYKKQFDAIKIMKESNPKVL